MQIAVEPSNPDSVLLHTAPAPILSAASASASSLSSSSAFVSDELNTPPRFDNLTCIVHGAAGSGKSTTGVLAFMQAVRRHCGLWTRTVGQSTHFVYVNVDSSTVQHDQFKSNAEFAAFLSLHPAISVLFIDGVSNENAAGLLTVASNWRKDRQASRLVLISSEHFIPDPQFNLNSVMLHAPHWPASDIMDALNRPEVWQAVGHKIAPGDAKPDRVRNATSDQRYQWFTKKLKLTGPKYGFMKLNFSCLVCFKADDLSRCCLSALSLRSLFDMTSPEVIAYYRQLFNNISPGDLLAARVHGKVSQALNVLFPGGKPISQGVHEMLLYAYEEFAMTSITHSRLLNNPSFRGQFYQVCPIYSPHVRNCVHVQVPLILSIFCCAG
jgi:hypothetical protein